MYCIPVAPCDMYSNATCSVWIMVVASRWRDLDCDRLHTERTFAKQRIERHLGGRKSAQPLQQTRCVVHLATLACLLWQRGTELVQVADAAFHATLLFVCGAQSRWQLAFQKTFQIATERVLGVPADQTTSILPCAIYAHGVRRSYQRWRLRCNFLRNSLTALSAPMNTISGILLGAKASCAIEACVNQQLHREREIAKECWLMRYTNVICSVQWFPIPIRRLTSAGVGFSGSNTQVLLSMSSSVLQRSRYFSRVARYCSITCANVPIRMNPVGLSHLSHLTLYLSLSLSLCGEGCNTCCWIPSQYYRSRKQASTYWR
jgi:hypothetical protein